MTNPDTAERLRELAERCETAPRPEFQIDCDIEEHLFGRTSGLMLPFTASLDAAMTLVPDDWRLAALCEREPWFVRLETRDFDRVTWGKGGDYITNILAGQETTAKAAAAALALCAAALRARAHQDQPTGEKP